MRNQENSSISKSWQTIFEKYKLNEHDFDNLPYFIDAEQIKTATKDFNATGQKEVRILCKQDTRESRPDIFKELGLFILPIKNGKYALLKGEGYIDIPKINSPIKVYKSQLDFQLETSLIGNSEMQHLDFAYNSGLIHYFMQDDTLVLTIRGRKYTPKFEMFVNKHRLIVESVQTEVDAGYEGKKQVVLIEAKNIDTENVIIRQLYFPFRQWKTHITKNVITIFFAKINGIYYLWKWQFNNPEDYNSVQLIDSGRFQIQEEN